MTNLHACTRLGCNDAAVQNVVQGRCAEAARQLDRRIGPHVRTERQDFAFAQQAHIQARNNHEYRFGRQSARIHAQVACVLSHDRRRQIRAVPEKRCMRFSKLQCPPCDVEFCAAVAQVRKQRAREAGIGITVSLESCEQARAPLVVHRTPVVRIDEREVECVVALVDIRHAGRGQLAERLRKRVQDAKARDPLLRQPMSCRNKLPSRGSRSVRTNCVSASSYSLLRSDQLVRLFASREALIMYAAIRCA